MPPAAAFSPLEPVGPLDPTAPPPAHWGPPPPRNEWAGIDPVALERAATAAKNAARLAALAAIALLLAIGLHRLDTVESISSLRPPAWQVWIVPAYLSALLLGQVIVLLGAARASHRLLIADSPAALRHIQRSLGRLEAIAAAMSMVLWCLVPIAPVSVAMFVVLERARRQIPVAASA